MIELAQHGIDGGGILAGEDYARRLGGPEGELHVAQKEAEEVDEEQLVGAAPFAEEVAHGHREGGRRVDQQVTQLQKAGECRARALDDGVDVDIAEKEAVPDDPGLLEAVSGGGTRKP